jgi:hypothetical protein
MNVQPQQQPVMAQPFNIPEPIQNGINAVSNTVDAVKNNISNSIQEFSKQPSAPSDFSYSNTMIAKFAFLIFAIIVFVFLINIGISLIAYFMGPQSNPYLIYGMMDGTNSTIIPQDPKNSTSVFVGRSNNQSTGAEFTWSVWLYLSDLGNSKSKYSHIFSKGSNSFGSDNIASPNNAPGLYLTPENNSLYVIMDTVSGTDTNNTLTINNLPLNKWFNVILRLENMVLDAYINGVITSRLAFQNTPKQNYNDVLVSQVGGFTGKLSNLRYYSYALNVFEINTLVYAGPNMTISSNQSKGMILPDYSYLSSLWYSANTPNQ